jgi:hypothetical protein
MFLLATAYPGSRVLALRTSTRGLFLRNEPASPSMIGQSKFLGKTGDSPS